MFSELNQLSVNWMHVESSDYTINLVSSFETTIWDRNAAIFLGNIKYTQNEIVS